MYTEADTFERGETLLSLVQGHWAVFDDSLDEDQQASLLEEIANADWDDDDGMPMVDAQGLYMTNASDLFRQTQGDVWDEFCDAVRTDPDVPIPFDDFIAEELAESEESLQAGTKSYRCRLGFHLEDYEKSPWNGVDIGPPPANSALAGRANADGQVVLYVADDEKTAVSEVRPALGLYVSVAELKLKRDCRILDLTKELPELNPFERDNLGWFLGIRDLLTRLGDEMARPLERNDDKTLYMPCQRLADYIRQNAYDGIRYPSALNPGGTNVVFFDPAVAEVIESNLVKVTVVNFDYERHKGFSEQTLAASKTWTERTDDAK